MFDPGTSEILAELEDGGKELSYLVDKLQISENEIRERLSYLLEHSFVNEKKNDNKIIVTADAIVKMEYRKPTFSGVAPKFLMNKGRR